MRNSKAYKKFISVLEAIGFMILNESKLTSFMEGEVYTIINDFLIKSDTRGLKEDFVDQCNENMTRHGLPLLDVSEKNLSDIGLGRKNDKNLFLKTFQDHLQEYVIKKCFKNAVYFHKLSNDPACGEMQAYYHKDREACFVGDANEIREILDEIKPHLGLPEDQILPEGLLLTQKEISRIIAMLRSFKIRERNDTLRVRGPLFNNDKLQISREVSAMSQDQLKSLFKAVQGFNSFNHDNDPYGEHDCAIFDHKRDKFMFKIDYYDLEFEGGIDPYSGEEYRAVMLIMFSHEY